MKRQRQRTPETKKRRGRGRRTQAARWMREDADRRLLPKFQVRCG